MPELTTTNSGICAAVTLKPTALTPKAARAFVRDVLTVWSIAEDLIWDASVVTSELTTNVLKHVPWAEELRVCVSMRGGQILIEVWDPSPEPPIVPVENSTGTSKRGLKQVVTNLSTTWYYTICPPESGGGKIVGARL